MFTLEDVLQLKEGEEVKEIVRRHAMTLFPNLLLAFALIVIPFFFLFPLFSWGIMGMGIFFVALLMGIGISLRTFMLWDADVLIVTSLRIVDVDQRGIFTRIVSEAPLASIQDLSWSQHGFFQTLFRIGSIRIQTANAQTAIEVKSISKPERVYKRIAEVRPHGHSAPAHVDHEDERRKRLQKISAILETYSADELNRIEAILKARET